MLKKPDEIYDPRTQVEIPEHGDKVV